MKLLEYHGDDIRYDKSKLEKFKKLLIEYDMELIKEFEDKLQRVSIKSVVKK